MERVKITRTIVHTAYVPRECYPGMSRRAVVDHETSLPLAEAVESLVDAGEFEVQLTTVVQFEEMSDR